jgi:predicted dehydrogenase
MHTSDNVLRFAIIGCGAVTEKFHLPVFDQIPQARVTHLVDLDEKRGQELARQFDIPVFTASIEDIYKAVDCVLVATPPATHIDIMLACYENGLHVICEKPLTKDPAEVDRLLAVRRDDRHMAVGMVRRRQPSAKLMKQFVQGDRIGKIKGFKVEEGSEFNWPLQTPHLFSANGYGGILMDTGTHIFDLVSWALDAENIRIDACRDDNWGGVEANVFIEAVMQGPDGDIPGTIDLSFTRALPNTITIYGEQGKLEVPARGGNEIHYYASRDEDDHFVVRSPLVDTQIRFNPFKAQIQAFAQSVLDGRADYVSVEQALRTIRAIERCRRVRQTQYFPWETPNIKNTLGVN